jgi:hypothetical protein
MHRRGAFLDSLCVLFFTASICHFAGGGLALNIHTMCMRTFDIDGMLIDGEGAWLD